MGLRSFFKISTGVFFASGITSANFHDRGRRCPVNDASRILHTGKAIRLAYSRRSQFGILSGPTDLEGFRFDRTFHTRSSDTSRNSGKSFSRERWVMGQDRRYSSRGSRNALFIEFVKSYVDKLSTSLNLTFMWLRRWPEQPFPPHNRFISLHQALGSSFFMCAIRDS